MQDFYQNHYMWTFLDLLLTFYDKTHFLLANDEYFKKQHLFVSDEELHLI